MFDLKELAIAAETFNQQMRNLNPDYTGSREIRIPKSISPVKVSYNPASKIPPEFKARLVNVN